MVLSAESGQIADAAHQADKRAQNAQRGEQTGDDIGQLHMRIIGKQVIGVEILLHIAA